MRREFLPWMIALVGACGPAGGPKKVEGKVEGKVEAKAEKVDLKTEKVERVTVDPTPKEEPVERPREEGPVLLAEAVRPGTSTLDGGKVEVESAGGWERRKVVGGGGAPNGYGGRLGVSEGGGGGGMADGIGSIGTGAPPPTGAPKAKGGAPPAEMDAASSVVKDRKQAGPLKAGSTDDNAEFKAFLEFLATWTTRRDVAGQFQPLAVEGRQFVRVLDSDGRPIPSALVRVRDAGDRRELWRARTYGDGRAPFYPKLWGSQVQSSGRYEVEVEAEGGTQTAAWDGKAELVVKTALAQKERPMALEVLFLIDTTGSMGDEIEQIKSTLLAVTGKVKAVRSDLELRYGAVLYKDLSDEYVTMAYPFTSDIAAFNQAMQSVTAGGGGDLPESLNQGLDRAVTGVPWQPEAAKVVFLVADAPPQMRFKGDVLYGDSAVQAVARGIRLHAVAASGLDELGTLVLRQLAQLTRGKFIFIEYGSSKASAESHGVANPAEGGNNLDDIIAREITAEIEGWGRP